MRDEVFYRGQLLVRQYPWWFVGFFLMQFLIGCRLELMFDEELHEGYWGLTNERDSRDR